MSASGHTWQDVIYPGQNIWKTDKVLCSPYPHPPPPPPPRTMLCGLQTPEETTGRTTTTLFWGRGCWVELKFQYILCGIVAWEMMSQVILPIVKIRLCILISFSENISPICAFWFFFFVVFFLIFQHMYYK